MKYNHDYVAAVAAVQTYVGAACARAVFNKLFDVEEDALAEGVMRVAPGVGVFYVRSVLGRIGPPREGLAVTWIKTMREAAACGLKEAKDIHDFLRSNPHVVGVAA